jgi:PAS domain S-box-containing protein
MENMYGVSEKLLLYVRQILDFIPKPLFIVDLENVVVYWNQAIEILTGVRKENMIGSNGYKYVLPFYGYKRKALIDLIFAPDHDAEETYTDFKREINGSVSGTVYAPKLDKYLWAKAAPFRDEQNAVIGAIEIVEDVTELKRLQDTIEEKVAVWKKDRVMDGDNFDRVLGDLKESLRVFNRSGIAA